MPAITADNSLLSIGRELLGSNQATKESSSADARGLRAAEGALFQIGMCLIMLGFCCGWLSVKHNLLRYRWKAPGRALLFFGHLFLMIFGCVGNTINGIKIEYEEYIGWNVCMMIVNLGHLMYILCYEKPIKFHPSLDQLWKFMFGPDHYNLEKLDFYFLVQERAEIQSFKAGQTYLGEQDVPGKLSILVDGKMVIYKSDDWGRREVSLPVFNDESHKDHVQMIVGEVNKFEFIDSFEWLSNGLDNNHAQVTIKADKECIVVSWDYDVLKEIFKDHPRLRACIMALVGKDVSQKLLQITGRTFAGHNAWSDMVRKNDKWYMCWRDADVRDVKEDPGREPDALDHPAFDMDEIIARLRIANARMLALHPSPLENLQPSAGVSSNAEHGAKLLNFFRRVVPDLPQRDLHELIKWGKWREYKKQFTIFLRKGEQPYYLGVVLDGQLDVLDEHNEKSELAFKHSVKEFELVGSEDFGAKRLSRAKRTIRVASHGAVLFVWDIKDLTRLMLADPRVESVVSTLLRGDITLKLRDSQSLTNRVCGDLDAIRRDGEGRACGPAILS
jgi:CRP-like cAMP-binding protein